MRFLRRSLWVILEVPVRVRQAALYLEQMVGLLVVRRLLGMSLVAEVTAGSPQQENQPLEITPTALIRGLLLVAVMALWVVE